MSFSLKSNLKKSVRALVHMAQWLEHQSADQRATGLIPGQGHVPGL